MFGALNHSGPGPLHEPLRPRAISAHWVAPADAWRLEHEWNALAAEAAEPNPFIESFMLRPALQYLAPSADVSLLTIREGDRLIAVTPIERRPRLRGLPLDTLRTFRHRHSYLGTPLVAADRARPALGRILHELAVVPRCDGRLNLPLFPCDGPLATALAAELRGAALPVLESDRFERAFYRVGAEPGPSVRTHRRVRQLSRRLASLGNVSFVTDDRADSPLVRAFHEFERRGWKGRAGTAIVQNPSNLCYFDSVLAGAAARGRLVVQALCAGDRPLVVNINIRAGGGIFALKTAFDESASGHSPGLLAEHQTLQWLSSDSRTAFLDTCAAPDHPMVNRIYRGRRQFADVLVCAAGWTGQLIARVWPLARHVRHLLRGIQNAQAPL